MAEVDMLFVDTPRVTAFEPYVGSFIFESEGIEFYDLSVSLINSVGLDASMEAMNHKFWFSKEMEKTIRSKMEELKK